ncbi:hypothetical protein ACOSQ3_022560 [Xanthoceras sorbifolium]
MLEKLYSHKSLARILQLKQQLQNSRKGSLSISECCLKIKTLGDALRAAGQTVTEYDMVLNVLNGVGHDYNPVVVLVSSQHKTVTMQETQYQLMMHEQRLEQLNIVSQVDVSSMSINYVSHNAANTSRGGNNNSGRGISNSRGGRGKGRKWNNNSKISYQLCSKTGHGALQCYRRFDQG